MITTRSFALRTLLLTTLVMIAFAANSLLCRLALGERLIDAASFTTLRLVSGALMLAILVYGSQRHWRSQRRDRTAVLALFVYAIGFSFAYHWLSAGTGALILFGAVQVTMIGAGLYAGENFRPLSWLGLTLAIAGLVYMVFPGLTAPSPWGAGLMTAAGIAWGVYSLRGRGTDNPLQTTAGNFLWTLPLAILVSILLVRDFHVSAMGILLAVASGAVASSLGYVVWYSILPSLGASRAAIVQLSVPIIAAFGGVLLLSEAVSLRLIVSSIAILGGIALVLGQRNKQPVTNPGAKQPAGDIIPSAARPCIPKSQ